jgi:hypothetical protein
MGWLRELAHRGGWSRHPRVASSKEQSRWCDSGSGHGDERRCRMPEQTARDRSLHRGKSAPQAEAPCAGVPDRLVEEYREAPVTHAHETGWRTNGNNGDIWLFASPQPTCSAGPGPRVCPRRCSGTPRCRDDRLSFSAESSNSLPRYSGGSAFALLIPEPGRRSPHVAGCTRAGVPQGDRSLTSLPLSFRLLPTGQQLLGRLYFRVKSWEQAMRLMAPSMVRLGYQNSQCDEPTDRMLVFPACMTLRKSIDYIGDRRSFIAEPR